MWDRHLRRVLLVEMGLIAVEGHPSVFRDTATGLLIVVHVDDVLVAGPSEHHAVVVRTPPKVRQDCSWLYRVRGVHSSLCTGDKEGNNMWRVPPRMLQIPTNLHS